ncbi:MAG: MerR family DNA-binding transcriptional regulator [Alphaproteobacteria bacterium]|nr:MerR family DNA-binding transcriptional regulator [Alphaproteobacteria bacterium]
MPTFKDYLTVKQAAKVLGVSIMTLHRWDAKGKLKASRHPINGYRLYRPLALKKLLKDISK